VGLDSERYARGLGESRGDALRRALDVTLATVGLVLGSPILIAAVIAIRVETRGSPIYRQRRVGKDGAPFDLLKLRTMVSGAEHIGAGLAIDEGDPRITRVGALLRRFSLDELPNLLNVLRGEMSIVGPRPTIQAQVDQYTERQRRRLEVKPGITGWAQVNGRASLPWHERIELDIWYVEHRSLRLDLGILAQSARLILTGHGLYRGESGGWRPSE
jgi:lipopolysaccharide/colanic/teichoic acid biosynthesis glycosyltransferase